MALPIRASKTNHSLMQVKSIAECLNHSAMLSTFIEVIPLFCLFLSGRFTQDLLYIELNIIPVSRDDELNLK